MTGKKTAGACCEPGAIGAGCRIEAVLSVDERGQMVLPKELRKRAKIKPGDRLALATWERDGRICCMALIRAEELGTKVQDIIGPLLRNMTGK